MLLLLQIALAAILLTPSGADVDVYAKTLERGFEIASACLFNRTISHVCYQCGTRHPEDFTDVFMDCCGEPDSYMREYCLQTFVQRTYKQH
ncbi:sodium-influx-stimulating peptide-like [Physella acuta]|uniref:sodium-influx-stimulating peptide-like n=1 Tax=Physella acuta TaxID=109671 RepID=UPI0027DD4969|nr:sodium-influx-stimulating peptide-like [Physella acuta]